MAAMVLATEAAITVYDPSLWFCSFYPLLPLMRPASACPKDFSLVYCVAISFYNCGMSFEKQSNEQIDKNMVSFSPGSSLTSSPYFSVHIARSVNQHNKEIDEKGEERRG